MGSETDEPFTEDEGFESGVESQDELVVDNIDNEAHLYEFNHIQLVATLEEDGHEDSALERTMVPGPFFLKKIKIMKIIKNKNYEVVFACEQASQQIYKHERSIHVRLQLVNKVATALLDIGGYLQFHI